MKKGIIILCLPLIFAFSAKDEVETVEMHLGGNSTIENTQSETCFGCGDCSVYCVIENQFSIESSSSLSSQGNNEYSPDNIDDYNLQTAWIEGADGDGLSEWIELQFNKQYVENAAIEINGFYLYNGYRKNQKVWSENARIKKLGISINGKDFLIVKLHDAVNQQSIDFEPVKLSQIEKIRFTILEVYPGSKFEDTALSELKLNGKHHH